MKILALDQASRTSGFSVFDDNKLVTSGKFTFEDSDMGLRLKKIRQKVENLINEYSPSVLVLEDIQLQKAVGNNVVTYKVLAQVIGVLIELATEKNIKYELVHSSTWKSYLGITGRTRPEQKKNAQAYVEKTYELKVSQDQSDAICIGTYYTNNKPATF